MDGERHLKIKKYANRRFYDATTSRHLTLADMHNLIIKGYDLTITDSKSGDDITNIVLTQIVLERDPPKLDIFPANVLHEVIRTQQQFLGTVVENYFRQVVQAQKASQERWAGFLTNVLGMPIAPGTAGFSTPLDWSRVFIRPGSAANDGGADRAEAVRPPRTARGRKGNGGSKSRVAKEPDQDAGALRKELDALEKRLADLKKKASRRK